MCKLPSFWYVRVIGMFFQKGINSTQVRKVFYFEENIWLKSCAIPKLRLKFVECCAVELRKKFYSNERSLDFGKIRNFIAMGHAPLKGCCP